MSESSLLGGTKRGASIFNTSENLEMCDVKVGQDGRVEITTKSYHNENLARMGRLTKKLAGSLAQTDEGFTFAPTRRARDARPTRRRSWWALPR